MNNSKPRPESKGEEAKRQKHPSLEREHGLVMNTAKIHPKILDIPLFVKKKDKPYIENEKVLQQKDKLLIS